MLFHRVAPCVLAVAAGAVSAQQLTSDTPVIDVGVGGTQVLSLQTSGPASYLMVGSASGTAGIPLGGGLTLPLTFDNYTSLTISLVNQGPFANTFGVTDASGNATASITLPAAPSFVGLSLNHAFIELDGAFLPVGVSNAVPLLLRENVEPFVSVSSPTGEGGEILTIQGHAGFDILPADDDTDFCVVLMPEETTDNHLDWIGLDVVAVDPALDQLQVQVPFWWAPDQAGAQVAGNIGIAKGEGNLVTVPTASAILEKVADGWVWDKTLDGVEVGTVVPFQLVAAPAAFAREGGDPCSGAAETVLNGFIEPDFGITGEDAWCILIPATGTYRCCDYVNVRPRFWSHSDADGNPLPTSGYDAEIGCHKLTDHVCTEGDPFSANEFATALQNVIVQTYLEHKDAGGAADPILLLPSTEFVGTDVKLCFYRFGRDFDAGQFRVYLY